MNDASPPILLVDDHPMVASSFAVVLEAQNLGPVAVADDLGIDAVVDSARRYGTGLALVDLHLGEDHTGVDLIGPLIAEGVTVVVLTASSDAELRLACFDAGAVAVIDKATPFDELIEMVRRAGASEVVTKPAAVRAALDAAERQREQREQLHAAFARLTPRESDVLRALVAGLSPKAIARDEGISVATVRGHLQAVFAKLAVGCQREALVRARDAGWPPETRERGRSGATSDHLNNGRGT